MIPVCLLRLVIIIDRFDILPASYLDEDHSALLQERCPPMLRIDGSEHGYRVDYGG